MVNAIVNLGADVNMATDRVSHLYIYWNHDMVDRLQLLIWMGHSLILHINTTHVVCTYVCMFMYVCMYVCTYACKEKLVLKDIT